MRPVGIRRAAEARHRGACAEPLALIIARHARVMSFNKARATTLRMPREGMARRAGILLGRRPLLAAAA